MKDYRASRPYTELDKSELIEIIERLEGTVRDLRYDNGILFKKNKRQMSDIVTLRRKIEAILVETGKDA